MLLNGICWAKEASWSSVSAWRLRELLLRGEKEWSDKGTLCFLYVNSQPSFARIDLIRFPRSLSSSFRYFVSTRWLVVWRPILISTLDTSRGDFGRRLRASHVPSDPLIFRQRHRHRMRIRLAFGRNFNESVRDKHWTFSVSDGLVRYRNARRFPRIYFLGISPFWTLIHKGKFI